MKLYGGTPGDPSVGIPSSEFSVEIGFELGDGEDRKEVKKQITKFMEELHDNGPANSWWEDECVDCGHILIVNKCMNKLCINNYDIMGE